MPPPGVTPAVSELPAAAGQVLGPAGPAVLDVVVALLVASVVAVVGLVVRRAVLVSARGAFDCRVRGRWAVARCEPARLAVFRTLDGAWWPWLALDREHLALVERRPAGDSPVPEVVLTVAHAGGSVELTTDERAAESLTVWLESAPPGRGADMA